MNTPQDINVSINVLVVDDIAAVRSVMRKLLGTIGFTTISEAADGEQALQCLNSSDVGLIISDWNMPKINGLDLLEQVRADEKHKHLPFIMITANKSREHVIEAANRGVSGYISKPFNVDTLRAKIIEAMRVAGEASA